MNETIKTLKAALKLLWDGESCISKKEEYICYSINALKLPLEVKEKAKRVIHENIGGYSTYGTYSDYALDSNFYEKTYPERQAERKAWLVALIAKLEYEQLIVPFKENNK